jgi:hypothetical protein
MLQGTRGAGRTALKHPRQRASAPATWSWSRSCHSVGQSAITVAASVIRSRWPGFSAVVSSGMPDRFRAAGERWA